MSAKVLLSGFRKVNPVGYSPELADVIVFQGTSASAAGHMQLYDGTQWISDFKQQDPLWPSSNPNSVWQMEKPSYTIYRFQGF